MDVRVGKWLLLGIVFLTSRIPAQAGVIEDVRTQLAQANFSAVDSELRSYRAQNGLTPEYLEALSWEARTALDMRQWGQASTYARQTQSLCLQQLGKRAMDAEPHLPLALGASYEVLAQALVEKGQRTQAVALLRSALAKYGNTSIGPRLQKNINLLALVGHPAPALQETQYLGPKPASLASLKGSPILLFFWAHWCVECKAEVPIITRLRQEFAPAGLVVVGPTQFYGYASQGADATPDQERAYIEAVRQRYYSSLLDMPVPLSKQNFNTYGASTTPTLVIVDRAGQVAMYHPGAMPYDELRSALQKVVAR
jgi:thiol-disulfide isomerase/thioredoxin